MKKDLQPFGHKHDGLQLGKLKHRVPPYYLLPDPEMIDRLNHLSDTIPYITLREWVKHEDPLMPRDHIILEEQAILISQIQQKLPKNYVFPDLMRLNHLFLK